MITTFAQKRDAVLADAPTLVLEAPVFARGAQLELGESAGDQLARVEDREVLPDDLVGAYSP